MDCKLQEVHGQGGSWLSFEYLFSCCFSCFHDALLDKFVFETTVKEHIL